MIVGAVGMRTSMAGVRDMPGEAMEASLRAHTVRALGFVALVLVMESDLHLAK